MDRKRSLWKKISLLSRKSSLDFVIALDLWAVVNCFSLRLRQLFHIYGHLIEIEYLLVLILWIS